MKSIFYSGAAGLVAQQEYMNNVGNNIANVNTTGYKTNTVSFEALLTSEMYVNTENDPLKGIGVKAVSTGVNMAQSGLKATNMLTDFALVGEGFFGILTSSGDVEYTRDGTFAVSYDGSNGYLVTQDGSFVLDNEGQKIELENIVNGEGTALETFELSDLTQKIGVYTFTYASALTPVANNRYVESQTSGSAVLSESEAISIRQGSLENSGVSLEDEMANLITGQRAYQLSARVLQVGDENEQTINGLRR